MPLASEREARLQQPNPLGIEGLEFVEFSTPRPQALGGLLEALGFRPVARHRSREVLLYAQGGMHIVVNAHGLPPGTDETPQIAAWALRVRDAAAAARAVEGLGAWPAPTLAQPMELHIPGVLGVGGTRIHFVDRWREFSIFDIDFVPIPTVQRSVPALAGLHWFGLVQYVGSGRAADWSRFYGRLFGFAELPREQRLGVLPAGLILRSPCGGFYLQLVEPPPDAEDGPEHLHRLAFGAPDVPAAVAALRSLGMGFVDDDSLRPGPRGALTQPRLGGVRFELVQHQPVATPAEAAQATA